ncbi:5-dehydro-2-deoxygluconokinase [Naasia sp. SYSU D00948]|uniref:5-dehydro-2-deoxygluconokinase n=1 Tax=Naasia sp. SYSU D00948 TaxID=2817379 RepID=UPI001B313F38|nr:5-dehydro-2-deoxygluconokinase [Naasia sp. SYSU D00948]
MSEQSTTSTSSVHGLRGRLDLLTLGRIGVDLYPLQSGARLEDVTSFGKFLGGSPTNVAVAAARHGLAAGVITRTGDDPFGRFAKEEAARLGVESRWITPVAGARTTIAFCEIQPPDHFPLYFYRDEVPPELGIGPEQLDMDAIVEARAFWSTATGLSREPSRAAQHAAWDARGRAPLTILDLDYRPGFWQDAAEAREEIGHALDKVAVAVGNLEECEIAVGQRRPEAAADALLDRGVQLAVIKQGPKGVLAKTADDTVEVPPTPVEVVNGLGAGDGFGGALCFALLSAWPLERAIRFASAAGALVASRLECSTAMPTTAEVDDLLAASGSTTT